MLLIQVASLDGSLLVKGASMKTPRGSFLMSFSVALLLANSAISFDAARPDIPEALRPPADQVLTLEAQATGVQIYECSPSKEQPGHYEWAFKAPEAELLDKSGRKIGKHYAGPTWESTDGSAV